MIAPVHYGYKVTGPRINLKAATEGTHVTIETLIWFSIILVIAALVWLAAPYHNRLIEAVHQRLKEEGIDRK